MVTGGAFLFLMLVGVPISLCLCLASMAFIWDSGNPLLFQSFVPQIFGGVDNYGLISIPLFILIGEVMNGGGITRRIVGMAMAIVGQLKGGLAYVNLLANMFISSILGSATAQVAIMAKVMVPEMERQGYDKTFAAGLTAYAGMLGPIIPPSIMFVIYSVMAQVPVSDMLMAGLVPGVILTGLFCAVIAIMGIWQNYPRGERLGLRQRARIVLDAAPTLIIPAVIVGSILTGLANATEAAAVGTLAAILVGRFWTRQLKFSDLPAMMVRSGIYSAVVLFLVAAAAVFSWVLVYGRVPQAVAEWVQTVASDPVTFMLLVNVILLVIGTVIDGAPGLIMTVPILLPIATEVYGIDPIHFGVVAVVNLVLGFLSPPVGLCFFVASAVTGAKVGRMFVVTLPFFFAACMLLLALSIFPSLSRRSLLRSAAGAAGAAAFGLASPTVLRAKESRDLRLGIITPNGHPWNLAAAKVGEQLKAETGGRLSLTIFPSGQLGKEADMLQQMQSGALDLGWIMTAELGSRIPSIAAINAPWIVDSTAKVAKLVRDPLALGMLDVLPKESGTIGLAYGITTMRVVFSAKPIEGLSDLSGMKLRINTTPAYRDFYSLLGATPTPIPTPAVFDAMSNGQVDGLEADLDFSWNQRFDKVSKTMLRMNAIFMPCVALASGRVWKTLDAVDRELITKLTTQALSAQINETVVNEPKLIESFTSAGIPIKAVEVADADAIISKYDAIWQPKAPILADLRKLGATL